MIRLLHIEDDVVDAIALKRAIRSAELNVVIEVCENGAEALDRLSRSEELPDAVVVDLKMPRMSGIDFLQIMADNYQELLEESRVAVFSASSLDADREAVNAYGVSDFYIKHSELDALVRKIAGLGEPRGDVRETGDVDNMESMAG